MASYFLATDPVQSTFFLPGSNTPGSGVKVFFYVNYTTTKLTVYKDVFGTAWSNPIVLDSGGNLPSGGQVYFLENDFVTVVYAPANDTDPPASPYRTINDMVGLNDFGLSTTQEWVTGTTPTFLSATSLRVSGDQRTTYDFGRRIRGLNTGGTSYAMVTSALFATGSTTIGINTTNSGVAMDAGLSAVSYSILDAANPSLPMLLDNVPFMADATDRSKTLGTRMSGLTTSTQRFWTVQNQDITVADINDTHGACIVTATSSQITLLPYNGNSIIINGSSCAIATSGISIGTSVATLEPGINATNNTVYFLYALSSTQGQVSHLRPSVSSAVRQNSTGIFIRNGDPTATLVGMYMLSSSFQGIFVDNVTSARFVRSWFNDPGINCRRNFTSNTNGGGVAYTEVAAYVRPLWLQWANEIARVSVMGGFGTNAATTQILAALGVDSATTPYDAFCMLQGSGWNIYPLSLSINVEDLAEGSHFASFMCKNSGGATAGINGDTVSAQATSIQVYVQK